MLERVVIDDLFMYSSLNYYSNNEYVELDERREKVQVPATKPYITFEGAGREVTVIEWHDRACDPGPDGEQLRTYRTASVTVLANHFTARNITFKVRSNN